jgi:ElaB/YqjD/DUF883 family membrane-anchored ribosome-binding protein
MTVGNNPQNIKNKAEEAGQTIGHAAHDVKQTVSHAAGQVGQQAKDAASMAAQQAKDLAASTAQQARETVNRLGQQASEKTQEALTGVGQGLQSLAGTIRQNVPAHGALGSTVGTITDNLQAGGRYLEEHDLNAIGSDLTGVVRRYPIQSVLIGMGAGLLLGMVFSRR